MNQTSIAPPYIDSFRHQGAFCIQVRIWSIMGSRTSLHKKLRDSLISCDPVYLQHCLGLQGVRMSQPSRALCDDSPAIRVHYCLSARGRRQDRRDSGFGE